MDESGPLWHLDPDPFIHSFLRSFPLRQIIKHTVRQVTALTLKKPVYIEIACNIAEEPISLPIPFQLPPRKPSNTASLRAALDTVHEMWNAAAKPVIVVGVKVCVLCGCVMVRLGWGWEVESLRRQMDESVQLAGHVHLTQTPWVDQSFRPFFLPISSPQPPSPPPDAHGRGQGGDPQAGGRGGLRGDGDA
jgi:hypothetical protein